jgi:hypothetical protein
MLYISKITSSFIDHELEHIIKTNFEKTLYVSKGVPITPSISGNELINTIINSIITNLTDTIQTEINNEISKNETVQKLNLISKNLSEQLTKITDKAIQESIQSKINTINSQIDLNIKLIIKNFNYDYYINVYKQQDNTRTLFNETLFDNIKLFNGLLVVFLIFFIFISLQTGSLTISDVVGVFTENIITFIFVGVIEVWFFMNVAFKYVPAPPSIIFVSLFNSLKSYLNKYTS